MNIYVIYGVMKINADIIILIMWPMLKFLLKSKDVFQVIWVKKKQLLLQLFWRGPKSPPSCLSKVRKSLSGIGLSKGHVD